jgi:hypothetical protein
MPLQPAVLGSARLNNFRLDYLSADLARVRATRVAIVLGGVPITGAVKVGSLRISDILNDAPNTCRFTFYGPTPPVPNQTLVITLNSTDPVTLFAGTLQTVATSYVGRPSTPAWDCSAIDDTALANRRRPFGLWANISATDVAHALVTTFAPALSTAGIEAGLPPVTVILDGTEGMSGAFQQLAKLIGGYFKFEQGAAFLFTTWSGDAPNPIDASHPFLDAPPVSASADVSQLRNRVYGRGHGEATLSDVAAADPIVPVADVAFFNPVGGQAIALGRIVTYRGVQEGGGGSLVGPGATPGSPPSATVAIGTGLAIGVYQYAFTDVTASGESLPSPIASVTTVAAAAAPALPRVDVSSHPTQPGNMTPGGAYQVCVTFAMGPPPTLLLNPPNETVASPAAPFICGPDGSAFVTWDPPSPPDPRLVYTAIYRTANGGSVFHLETYFHFVNPVGTFYYFGAATEAQIVTFATAPTSDNTVGRRVALTAIATGPSPTTARKLYRTVVNGTLLKLLTTLADNTTTTYTDATADGSLGAAAPTSDLSGLTQPSGQVRAGSTSLLLAGAGAFAAGGGWAVIGNGQQVVRYTGISVNTLTGIPASGVGAITATISYNSTATVAPALTGMAGNTDPIPKGTPVNLWVQRDDRAAQATQRAIDIANGDPLADGIYEGAPLVDERRNEASLIALCDATLAIFATAIRTVRYATRDLKTKSGKPVSVNLASPPIVADLVIQDVQISEIDIAPGLAPRFEVTASTTRFSLDNLIRQLAKTLGGQ